MFFENFKESVFLSKVIVVANKQLTSINSAIINNNLASNIFAAGLLGFLFFCHPFLSRLSAVHRRKKGKHAHFLCTAWKSFLDLTLNLVLC